MEWQSVHKLIREIEENADRCMERGILDSSAAGVTNAHVALGVKRGMRELRDRIRLGEQMEQQAAIYRAEEENRKQMRKQIRQAHAPMQRSA